MKYFEGSLHLKTGEIFPIKISELRAFKPENFTEKFVLSFLSVDGSTSYVLQGNNLSFVAVSNREVEC